MEKGKSEIEGGYTVIPRRYVSDCRNGKLTIPERNLLAWIRQIADMRGVAHCTMEGLANEAFNCKVDKSYINRLIRSLKRKRYLWYQDRNGRRGSFEVHLPDWFLSDGKIKKIDHLFEQESVRGEADTQDDIEAEDSTYIPSMSQSIEDSKKNIRNILSSIPKS